MTLRKTCFIVGRTKSRTPLAHHREVAEVSAPQNIVGADDGGTGRHAELTVGRLVDDEYGHGSAGMAVEERSGQDAGMGQVIAGDDRRGMDSAHCTGPRNGHRPVRQRYALTHRAYRELSRGRIGLR
jgi:hypothetical protein